MCSDVRNGTNISCGCLQTPIKEVIMDRSYRLKMEERLNMNILTKEYILSCIVKPNKRIGKLLYKKKQYKSVLFQSYELEIDEEINNLIKYRKPFIDVLMKDYNMSLDDIKTELQGIKDKNIPTNAVCDNIRNIIINGCYFLE